MPLIAEYQHAPPRLAPFLASWDYMSQQLLERLEGLTDEELVWEPAPTVLTVRRRPDGTTGTDAHALPPDSRVQPPRTLAWSINHLGSGTLVRADWLVGSHALDDEDVPWPLTAAQAIDLLRRGLAAWRNGLDGLTDEDLDTVGRSAYPHGLDPTLPLLDIVWWVHKELLEHAAEIWYVRDLYAASR